EPGDQRALAVALEGGAGEGVVEPVGEEHGPDAEPPVAGQAAVDVGARAPVGARTQRASEGVGRLDADDHRELPLTAHAPGRPPQRGKPGVSWVPQGRPVRSRSRVKSRRPWAPWSRASPAKARTATKRSNGGPERTRPPARRLATMCRWASAQPVRGPRREVR